MKCIRYRSGTQKAETLTDTLRTSIVIDPTTDYGHGVLASLDTMRMIGCTRVMWSRYKDVVMSVMTEVARHH